MNSVAIPATAASSALSTEAELVRQAARGDAEAFGELYRRHSQPAWRVAQAVAPDRDGAVAAFGDGFVRALRGRATRRGAAVGEPFRPAVLGSVYRSALDQAYDRSAPPAGARRARSAEAALADAAFRSLPERWRAAVWLSEVENLDADRVATVLGVSVAVATQLVARGRRGLAGRFAQAHHEMPAHIGEVLRPLALAMPANLADVTQARWAAAGSERGPVLAPVSGWLAERGVRPMAVTAGALLGLGLIGLGVVPQGSSVRATLGAAGIANPAGALPVHTCDGLTCPAGATSNGSASGGGFYSTQTSYTSGSRSALYGGGSGGPGGFGSYGAYGSPAGGGAGGSGAGGAGSSTGGGTAGGGTGGGGTTGGTTTGGSGGSGTGTNSGGGSGGTTQTLLSVGGVGSVTQTGGATTVSLVPSGSSSLLSTTVGCSGTLGVSVAGTTLVGCGTGSTSTSPTTTAPAPTTTTTISPLTSTVGGVTSTVGGVVSGTTNLTTTTTTTTTTTSGGLLGGL